jgi:osmotically-inducible protein OsmY
VETEEGRTVLTGTAPNAAARDRAEGMARAVDGVKSVDNRLEVKP